jgi:hypothetical protein
MLFKPVDSSLLISAAAKDVELIVSKATATATNRTDFIFENTTMINYDFVQ